MCPLWTICVNGPKSCISINTTRANFRMIIIIVGVVDYYCKVRVIVA